jgi:hypothetical protein
VPAKLYNNTTKKGKKKRQIFNYVHKAPSGHLATCKQNCGAKYGSLQTCFRNLQFSNEKVQLAFENGEIIWTITLNGLELTSFEFFFNENKACPHVNSTY